MDKKKREQMGLEDGLLCGLGFLRRSWSDILNIGEVDLSWGLISGIWLAGGCLVEEVRLCFWSEIVNVLK